MLKAVRKTTGPLTTDYGQRDFLKTEKLIADTLKSLNSNADMLKN